MFANNREDELLQKLKSCVGALNDRSFQLESKSTKTTPLKQIPKEQPIHNRLTYQGFPKQNLPPENVYSSYQRSEHMIKERPLAQTDLNLEKIKAQVNGKANLEQYRIDKNNYLKNQVQQNNPSEQILSKYRQQIRRNEYKQNNFPQDILLSQRKLSKEYDARSEIARRHSVMQNQKTLPIKKYDEDSKIKKETPQRNYQRQVNQRKNIVNQEQPKTTREPQNKFLNMLRMQHELGSEKQNNALQKLKKISELNEKINERIRNIINVFDQHKC